MTNEEKAEEIYKKKIDEAATFLFKQRGLDKESCRQAMDYILSNQWISVEEALPDKGREVLVAILNTKTNTHFFGFDAIVDDSVFLRDKNGFTIDVDYHKITHWMPIPSMEGGEK